MGTPFVGEIRMFGGNFAPLNWAFCNGQLLPIAQYDVLFALIGTTYGGDGVTTFALPDLQGRIPIHIGSGFVQGQRSGEENHTLLISEIPSHTHTVGAKTQAATNAVAGGVYGGGGLAAYKAASGGNDERGGSADQPG